MRYSHARITYEANFYRIEYIFSKQERTFVLHLCFRVMLLESVTRSFLYVLAKFAELPSLKRGLMKEEEQLLFGKEEEIFVS